jgi:hypothetical protein
MRVMLTATGSLAGYDSSNASSSASLSCFDTQRSCDSKAVRVANDTGAVGSEVPIMRDFLSNVNKALTKNPSINLSMCGVGSLPYPMDTVKRYAVRGKLVCVDDDTDLVVINKKVGRGFFTISPHGLFNPQPLEHGFA